MAKRWRTKKQFTCKYKFLNKIWRKHLHSNAKLILKERIDAVEEKRRERERIVVCFDDLKQQRKTKRSKGSFELNIFIITTPHQRTCPKTMSFKDKKRKLIENYQLKKKQKHQGNVMIVSKTYAKWSTINHQSLTSTPTQCDTNHIQTKF